METKTAKNLDHPEHLHAETLEPCEWCGAEWTPGPWGEGVWIIHTRTCAWINRPLVEED